MRCKKVLARLDDHVDGLLPVHESEAIRDHLDLCEDCRASALVVKAATTSLAAWDDVEPSPDCFGKILSRLESLPVEAFERGSPAPRARLLSLPRLSLPRLDLTRTRRVATGGLAAAAALLAAAVMSRTEARPTSHVRTQWSPSVPVGNAGAWLSAGAFDDGLLYQRGGRPMMQPVHAAAGLDFFEATPR